MEIDVDLLEAVGRLGLIGPGEQPVMAPLKGGVSSDIWRVETASQTFCVKRALAKLKVAADWRAPVERNAYEAAWMQEAGRIVPDAVPALLGQDEASGVLVMAYLPPEHFSLWKDQLFQGHADADVAAKVGRCLVMIHAATADRDDVAERFRTDDIFYDIRLEPYLVATAEAHPACADALTRLVDTTRSTKRSLVHGDVSPKNILIGKKGPVFLDAECAWYGDPAFDLAFCLNHLLLKCLLLPAAKSKFLACFRALAERYLEAVNWEPKEDLEARAAALLPGLMLARIDGKSPVEYLTDDRAKDQVRTFAADRLIRPPRGLFEIGAAWEIGEAWSKEGGERA